MPACQVVSIKIMKKPHTFTVRVYYEDTDAAGIVYYANYLKFAERARTEALRLSGINQSDLFAEKKIAGEKINFVVRRCVVDFFKPARLDDLLTIDSHLQDISKVSMNILQSIKLGKETLVELEVKLVMVDENMKLAKLPEFVQKAMLKIFK